MVVKYSRADRRRHAARMKKRATYIVETQWWWGNPESPNDNSNKIKWINRMYNNMKVCSCYMCCNERRNPYAESPLTLQERKAEDSFNDQLEDYFCGP